MRDENYEVKLNDTPQDIAKRTVDMWTINEPRIQEWQDRAVDSLNFVMNYLPPKSFPWKNCSNVNVPITRIKRDAMVTTLCQMLFGNSAMIQYRAKGNTPSFIADIFNRTMDSEMAKSTNFTKEVYGFVMNFWNFGVAYLKKHYRMEYQKVPRRVVIPYNEETPGELQGVPVMFGEQKLSIQTTQMDRIFSGHMIESLCPFNIMESPGAQCIDKTEGLRHARWLMENTVLYESDLILGNYDQKAVAELLKRRTDRPKLTNVEKEKNLRLGLNQDNFSIGYNAIELWMWHPVPGQGREVLMRYVVADSDGGGPILLLQQECPFSHYSIPIIHASTDPTAFRGESIPQILMPLQEEINTQHNMRLDAITLNLLKMWKVRQGSKFDVNQELFPGAMLPVYDMGDFQPVISNEQGIPTSHEEELLSMTYAERLTVSDITNGVQSSMNPEQTATGTVTLLNQAEAKVAYYAKYLQAGALRRLGKMYLEDTLQFHPIDQTVEYKDVLSEQNIDIDSDQAILQILMNTSVSDFEVLVEIGDSAGMRMARMQAAMQALQIISQYPEVVQTNYGAIKQLFDEMMRALQWPHIKMMSVEDHKQYIAMQQKIMMLQQQIAQTNESLTNVEREKARADASQQEGEQNAGTKDTNAVP